MKRNRFLPHTLIGLTLLLILGCAHPISRQMRRQVVNDLTFPMVLHDPDAYSGSIVIWGGIILNVVNRNDWTEFVVLEIPLDYGGRPQDRDASCGRFLARSLRYLDPEIYKKGRRITVAGEVVGKETMQLGETQYTYPVIQIKELYLWKREVVAYSTMPYYPYYNWYWYDPYYTPFYGPFHRRHHWH